MRNWFKAGVVGAGFVLLCLMSVACEMFSPTDIAQSQTVIVHPPPPPPLPPVASPSPAPGPIGKGRIVSLRLGVFGYGQVGGAPPCPLIGVPGANGSGRLPVDCEANITLTPKCEETLPDGTVITRDCTLAEHGTEASIQLTEGMELVDVGAPENNPIFNRDCRVKRDANGDPVATSGTVKFVGALTAPPGQTSPEAVTLTLEIEP